MVKQYKSLTAQKVRAVLRDVTPKSHFEKHRGLRWTTGWRIVEEHGAIKVRWEIEATNLLGAAILKESKKEAELALRNAGINFYLNGKTEFVLLVGYAKESPDV